MVYVVFFLIYEFFMEGKCIGKNCYMLLKNYLIFWECERELSWNLFFWFCVFFKSLGMFKVNVNLR